MDDQTFARSVSAWLDPLELLKAAMRYDRDRDRALAREGLLISSPHPASFPTMMTSGNRSRTAVSISAI